LIAIAIAGHGVAHAQKKTKSGKTRSAGRTTKTSKPAWINHYLPEDRGKITGGVWKFVSTEDDQVYHYGRCGQMLSQPRQRAIGFDTADSAYEAGYTPCKQCRPTYSFAQYGEIVESGMRALLERSSRSGFELNNLAQEVEWFRKVQDSTPTASVYRDAELQTYRSTVRTRKGLKQCYLTANKLRLFLRAAPIPPALKLTNSKIQLLLSEYEQYMQTIDGLCLKLERAAYQGHNRAGYASIFNPELMRKAEEDTDRQLTRISDLATEIYLLMGS
jgi:hypothetical protein